MIRIIFQFFNVKSGEAYLRLTDRISRSNPADFALSVISFHEQCLRANTLISGAKRDAQIIVGYDLLNEILRGFAFAPVSKFDQEAANCFQRFRSQGIRIGTMDLRISSICLVNDSTLLTRNRRDFEQVPGLSLDDWTS